MPVSVKVVDSWAMVAWIRDEPTADAVEEFLDGAEAGRCQLVMSWINAAETFYILAKRESPELADGFLTRLRSLPIRMVLPDEEGIMGAARIKAIYPVAFGDAFAIALAQSEKGSVITGDGEIRRCGVVPVDWVGAGWGRRFGPVPSAEVKPFIPDGAARASVWESSTSPN